MWRCVSCQLSNRSFYYFYNEHYRDLRRNAIVTLAGSSFFGMTRLERLWVGTRSKQYFAAKFSLGQLLFFQSSFLPAPFSYLHQNKITVLPANIFRDLISVVEL